MIKFLINTVKSAIEQQKTQSRLNILIGKKKKSDYIKLKLPKKYIPILEVVVIYGIDDSDQLLNIIEKAHKQTADATLNPSTPQPLNH